MSCFLLVRLITSKDHAVSTFNIARTYFNADRNALFDPFPVFFTAANISTINMHREGSIMKHLSRELFLYFFSILKNSFALLIFWNNWDDDNMVWRDARRKSETIIIAMTHDNC